MKQLIEKLISFIIGIFDFDKRKPLMPKQILKKIIRTSRKNKFVWSSEVKPEAPNDYTILISPKDWDLYYGARIEEVQSRLSAMASRKLAQKGFLQTKCVSVSIMQDAAIQYGRCAVRSAFTPLESLPTNIETGKAAHCEPTVAVNIDTLRIDRWPQSIGDKIKCVAKAFSFPQTQDVHDSQIDESEPSVSTSNISTLKCSKKHESPQTLRMPIKQDVAVLSSGQYKYAIRHGCTVGAVSVSADVDVHLMEPSDASAPPLHGVFKRFREGWFFENWVEGGTTVVHADGSIQHLAPGESCGVYDGDSLLSGPSIRYSFKCSTSNAASAA